VINVSEINSIVAAASSCRFPARSVITHDGHPADQGILTKSRGKIVLRSSEALMLGEARSACLRLQFFLLSLLLSNDGINAARHTQR
jgi:hypothetical protein